jgi:hypothetical protein
MDTSKVKHSRFYKAIDVWRIENEWTLAVYRCFEVLPDHKYCVQSKDFYRSPFDQSMIEPLHRSFLELLSEEPPELRGGLHDSLEDAISAHDDDFSNI